MSERKKRLGKIIRHIANNPGTTLTGLCSALREIGIEVSERTVAKDIASLKHEFGLLPQEERMRSGYALENIAVISDDQRQLIAAQADSIMRRTIYGKSERIEALLLSAIRQHAAVEMEYVTPRLDMPPRITEYPLMMEFHERGWYCITRDLKSKTYNPRRLDRVRLCSLLEAPLNATFEADLVEAKYLISCGWGMNFPRTSADAADAKTSTPIVARFDRTVAPYILESLRRHPFGTVTPARDGTGDAIFKIRLSDPREFVFWIRSFGSKARITAPPALVQKERAEIRRMLAQYES